MGGERSATPPSRTVVPTAIGGLDLLLDGGLRRGGPYLVAGPPGSGKTTLGNQLAFARARAGDVAIYATVLAETHERMLVHLRGFEFFAPEVVAQRVHYVSLYDELSEQGLSGALSLLRRLVREHPAALLVIDGASLFDDFALDAVPFRRFMSELHAQTAALACTTLLLADDEARTGGASIGYQVDGMIALEDQSEGLCDLRLIRVVKLRGADPLRGRHHFAITRAGVEVSPRLEAVVGRRQHGADDAPAPGRQEFGVEGLDEMLGGGLPEGSSTLMLGLPGTDKTIGGLHFIAAGARRGERGLIVSADESPRRLMGKADRLGLALSGEVDAGHVRIVWQPVPDVSVDAWAHRLLAVVDDDRPRRVGVLIAADLRALVGTQIEIPPPAYPVTVENAILLRYVELRSQLRRLLSIVKVRDAAHDTSLREFVIDPGGIDVASTFESADAVLSGLAQSIASPPIGPPFASAEVAGS
jgi:circadian clock protein KaiC